MNTNLRMSAVLMLLSLVVPSVVVAEGPVKGFMPQQQTKSAAIVDFRGSPPFDRHGRAAMATKHRCHAKSGVDFHAKPPFNRSGRGQSAVEGDQCAENTLSRVSPRQGGPRHHPGKRYRED